MDDDLPHLWPAQDCPKCGKPVGGEVIHRAGSFYHPECLGLARPQYEPSPDDEDCPF